MSYQEQPQPLYSKNTPDEQAFFNFLYRKHVKNAGIAKCLKIWWNITGRKQYKTQTK